MKKILSFTAILAFVGAASAASLNWTITNVYQSNDSTTKAQGYSAYLFITEQAKDYGAQVTTVEDITTLITSKGNLEPYIAAGPQLTGATGGITAASTGYYNAFDAGDSLTAFAVIFDAATYAEASHFIVTGEKSASWTSSAGAKTLGFGSMAAATSTNPSWTAVPEPATAALALLGLGLMIKRRKA
ncbi:MAG: PEP-CTERM sorting domain-containing protein [Kiritimatiellae bacterium]|nr:PEP-CTERM sorting domain-containing protein [Kiritimatiellia bacterium]